jgi:UDP:flavonoid glycosyltransferase YjiC (YdhE family)
VGEEGDPALPANVEHGSGRPLVYLTFGTVFNDNAAFRAALAGIGELPVNLVVTVGPASDPGAFGPQPANVAVERYIPQMALLPSCDVVVSHAGSGTVLATLGLGIPQLCLPQAADQFLNAAAVVRPGCGARRPSPGELVDRRILATTYALLDDPDGRLSDYPDEWSPGCPTNSRWGSRAAANSAGRSTQPR